MTRANNAGKRGGARYGQFTKASFNDPANTEDAGQPHLG